MSCPCNSFRRKRKGWPNFISRSRVLDASSLLLDEYGTLTVIVKIQIFREKEANFVPRNEVNLVRLLEEANATTATTHASGDGDEGGKDADLANAYDVTFNVGGEIVRAHRLILKLAAPALAQLCEDADEDDEIPVAGVRPSIFRGVLRYAYGGSVPEESWTTPRPGYGDDGSDGGIFASPAMEYLDAADLFGVSGLKILAEARVAEHDVATASASDLILYADAKHCPLLKERAIDHFVSHAEEVKRHPTFEKVRESASVLDELLEALLDRRVLRSSRSVAEGGDRDYDGMGVNLLRTLLDERGMDVDGSREMLVRRLRARDERVGLASSEGGTRGEEGASHLSFASGDSSSSAVHAFEGG
ncbi:hypothetical protein ACHAWF_014051 [Thalassiosira exigua]